MAEKIEVVVTPRSSEFKLMLLRLQLFTAMEMLSGDELAEFWKLIDEVEACRPPSQEKHALK